ncbi:MAG: NADH:ubiquinone reductase (Na(+)-transporting) subunit B [Desulfosarcina sp.]|nr:NADH:ubiquinone reductase (Na(+)-transporting) subunit B [Desulfobacterales bacterium]
MKAVRNFFDALRPHFESGGKYAKLYAFYESIETVFLAPIERTRRRPNVRDSLDVKRFMFLVIVALIPHLCFGIYNAGYHSRLASGLSLFPVPVVLTGLWLVMPMVIVSYAVGFFWEILFATIRKHEISEGLFVSCMLFPLTLPPTTPLWQVALGISFGIVIGKEVFGGTGRNFLNPALTGRAFLYFAYPVSLSGDSVWTALSGACERFVDGFTAATPLSVSASTPVGQPVEEALHAAGYSTTELFFGFYPGSIGGTSTFLCIVGALFLIVLGIASWRIILGGVLGVLATAFCLKLLAGPESMAFLSLNPFYHLLIGGSAFGIVYMTTDPVSATHMRSVKWVYGFMCGMLTVLIRVFNPAFPEGIGLAILFMNLFNPLLDHIEVRIRTRRRVPNV